MYYRGLELTVAVVTERRFTYVKNHQSCLAKLLSISRNSYAANSYRLGQYLRQEFCILALFLHSEHQLFVSAGNEFLSFVGQ